MIKYKDIMQHFHIAKTTAYLWVKKYVPASKVHHAPTMHVLPQNVWFDDDVIDILEKAVVSA